MGYHLLISSFHSLSQSVISADFQGKEDNQDNQDKHNNLDDHDNHDIQDNHDNHDNQVRLAHLLVYFRVIF